MQNKQPKFLTRDELRSAAMRGLNVSKSAFDFGWMVAIEDTGRHDWYEPLRRRLRHQELACLHPRLAAQKRYRGRVTVPLRFPSRTPTTAPRFVCQPPGLSLMM